MISNELQSFQFVEALPVPPAQVTRVLDIAGRSSAMDYNIIHVIQYDPAIASRVLFLGNSRLYGYPSQVDSLQQAAGLLGPGVVKSIILTTPVLERFNGDEAEFKSTIDFDKLWQHSSIAGALAGRLGGLWEGFEADVCFTAGLLNDLGKIALAVMRPRLFVESVEAASRSKGSLDQSLHETAGFTTRGIGRCLAENWNYPEQLIDSFGGAGLTGQKDDSSLGVLARLAATLADNFGYDDGLGLDSGRSVESLCNALGQKAEDLKAHESDLLGCVSMVLGD